jgi:hypothetical protein
VDFLTSSANIELCSIDLNDCLKSPLPLILTINNKPKTSTSLRPFSHPYLGQASLGSHKNLAAITRAAVTATDIPSWLRGSDVAMLRTSATNGDTSFGGEGGWGGFGVKDVCF